MVAAGGGKNRKDKFYHLAKEIGFRSRASFKLIQLNRKYGFLDQSKVCVDLCAAPGGWMQVAQKTMLPNSIIIGVDQDPIKSLNKCIALQEDIMSDKCIKNIHKSMKSWKADVVLCDGAPHYGEDFKIQTVIQNKLVIRSLEIATKTLQKEGWFVTKIAKTRYFDAVVGTLSQFFKKVYVTKPEASRKESSECYAICRGYLAPKKIDKDSLDINVVFKDNIEIPIIKSVNEIFKRNPKRLAINLNHIPVNCKAIDFIKNDNYLDILAASYQITFDGASCDIIDHPLTTDKIKDCCEDLKMLDKKSVKEILKWRRELAKKLFRKEKIADNIENNEEYMQNTENNDQKPISVQDVIKDEFKEKRKLEKKSKKRAEKLKNFTTQAEIEEELFDIENHAILSNSNEINYFEVDEAEKNIPDTLFIQNQSSNQPITKYVSSNEWIGNLMKKNNIEFEADDDQFSDDPEQKALSEQKKKKTNTLKQIKNNKEPKIEELNAEELAIATAMATSKKRKRDLIENSANRYMNFDDESVLPDWFIEDQKIANRPVLRNGISEHEIESQRINLAKKGRVNSRSLSKLAEVRARKKRKLDSKLLKANTAAQGIIDNEFAPTNLKVKKMRDLYRNVLKKKEKKYIVTKKKHDGKMPKNVKGPYKMVDKKMKKDKPRGKKK